MKVLESSLGKNKRKGGDTRMVKRLLLVLVMVSFMVGVALAGVEEVQTALNSHDWATLDSEVAKVLADKNATDNEKATSIFYQGYGLMMYQKKYAEAAATFQKVIDNYPKEFRTAFALVYMGSCFKEEAKSQAAFLQVLTDWPEIGEPVRGALDGIKFALLPSEDVARICLKIWKVNIPATEENSDILSKVQFMITQYVPGITEDNLNIPEVEEAIENKWGTEVK